MRKTVEIQDDLKEQIDRLRIERGESMKKIVNDALRRGLLETGEWPQAERERQNKVRHPAGSTSSARNPPIGELPRLSAPP
jgi:hypothetical protein